MTSPKGLGGESEADLKFPEANAHGELNPGPMTKDFPVDSVSSDLAHSKEIEEEVEGAEKKEERQSMKSTLIISSILVAVIGAIFAVSKKLRDT